MENIFIHFLHVSEYIDNFQAIKVFFRKKPEIYWSGGTPPLIGKRPIYFRFFLMKASLRKQQQANLWVLTSVQFNLVVFDVDKIELL